MMIFYAVSALYALLLLYLALAPLYYHISKVDPSHRQVRVTIVLLWVTTILTIVASFIWFLAMILGHDSGSANETAAAWLFFAVAVVAFLLPRYAISNAKLLYRNNEYKKLLFVASVPSVGVFLFALATYFLLIHPLN